MMSQATNIEPHRPRIAQGDAWRRAARTVPEWLPAAGSWRQALAAPVSPTTWRSITHLTLTALVGTFLPLLIGYTGLIAALMIDPYRAMSGAAFWLATLLTLALVAFVLLLLASPQARALRWVTAQRDLREVPAPRPLRLDFTNTATLIRSLVASRPRWLLVGKVLACGLVATAGLGAFLALGILAVRYLAIPIHYRPVSAIFEPVGAQPTVWLPGAQQPWSAIVIGLTLAYLAALVAQGAGSLSVRVNRALLQPGSDEVLGERVEELTRTRSGVVDAADDERRRIERDLHDGAQQRLVALSVDLGLARREARQDPAAALTALEHAQSEVEASLRELRDLVRGIYPQVLTDRGLHEAVEALVTRAPLPTALESPGPRALEDVPAPVRSAAYFVVSECLANAARHSGAGSALVRVEAGADRLAVSVSDDGAGGATFAAGRGLDGLRKRVTALDGSFILTSPAGGGTKVTAVFPWAA